MFQETSEKRALALELLNIERKLEADIGRIDQIKSELKAIANSSGGFKEEFAGLGSVRVTADSTGKLKGILPVLDAELYLASDVAERERLEQEGIVTMTHIYSRPGHAAVTVTLVSSC